MHIPGPPQRPAVQQVYNMFHAINPLAGRLEPLLSARFAFVPPVSVPRFQKHPLGDGFSYHLCECCGMVFLLCEMN